MARPYKKYRLTDQERDLIGDPRGLAWWFVRWCVKKGKIQSFEADDLASYCIFRICRAIRNFDPSKGKYTTYMICQCKGALGDYYRNKREVVSLEWDVELEQQETVDSEFLRHCIESAKLTKRQRQILLLRMKYNFAEIGRELKCARWGVFMVYQAGIERLRNYMRIHGHTMKDFAA